MVQARAPGADAEDLRLAAVREHDAPRRHAGVHHSARGSARPLRLVEDVERARDLGADPEDELRIEVPLADLRALEHGAQ